MNDSSTREQSDFVPGAYREINKAIEYLSFKVGIIVTGVSTFLLPILELELRSIVVLIFLLSCALWYLVWRFVLDPQSISKRIVLFWIHVLATTIAPFLAGLFTVGNPLFWVSLN